MLVIKNAKKTKKTKITEKASISKMERIEI